MTTLTVYAGAADGYITSTDGHDDGEGGGYEGTYSLARAGTGAEPLAADTTATGLLVGQTTANGGTYNSYSVYEGFLGFDTSAIGAGDTVSSAVPTLTSDGDLSTTDFDLQMRSSDWGATLTTADMVAGTGLSALTLRAHRSTASGWVSGTAYSLTDDAMAAGVVKGGTTRLLLCSSRQVSGSAPGGTEYVGIKSADTVGTTSDPKLTVEYTAGGGGGSVLIAAALTASATLSAAAGLTLAIVAPLTASATLAAVPAVVRGVGASLTGTATLDAVAAMQLAIAASLVGNATLAARFASEATGLPIGTFLLLRIGK